jgi:hypothetical protein
MPKKKRSEEEDQQSQPPQPPEIDRGLEMNRSQMIGFPIIMLIPILALAGMFGEDWASAEASALRLGMRVEYPTRLRAKLSKPMTVAIENRSALSMDTVEVVFDSLYIDRFTAVDFIPSAEEVYTVSVTDLKAGETRRVHVELEGDIVGRHSGRIVARTRDDSAAVVVHTTVFP